MFIILNLPVLLVERLLQFIKHVIQVAQKENVSPIGDNMDLYGPAHVGSKQTFLASWMLHLHVKN